MEKHKLELSNEEYHYLSALLSNRGLMVPKEKELAAMEAINATASGQVAYYSQEEIKLGKEETLIESLLSKFVSI